ncbi:MAG: patatin-like phospholipase family protein [Rikenellaceae bacterium]|nr:patatin-like phospholipase family protein [Rikenellaceae bacterium]
MDKCVSLALSSGGPRGFAYIGAIEELTSRGYRIGSVAGTSIGSLVGGIYAAGKLDEFKEWLFALDAWKVFTLMDLSIGKNHIVKGERIIEAMREIVPDVDIESLPIPFRAVATDLYTGEEVVFDHGKLFEAIRASISIPSLFQPVKHGLTTLVDGCIANCLPLSRVVRTEGDILVAFDVNDVDVAEIRSILTRENAALVADTAFEQSTRAEMRGILDSVTNRSDIGLVERLKSAGSRSMSLIKDVINYEEEYDEAKALDYGDTYYDLLDRSFSLMNHRQSELSIALHRPDIVVKMPFDAYGEIADYAKAKEISEIGRQLMREALDRYEGK